jgi:hypothetical protein
LTAREASGGHARLSAHAVNRRDPSVRRPTTRRGGDDGIAARSGHRNGIRDGNTSVYRGAYQDANGVIMFLFEFQGRSVGTSWDDATGTLKGDSLTVKYDEIMQHADFENAAYVLMP